MSNTPTPWEKKFDEQFDHEDFPLVDQGILPSLKAFLSAE